MVVQAAGFHWQNGVLLIVYNGLEHISSYHEPRATSYPLDPLPLCLGTLCSLYVLQDARNFFQVSIVNLFIDLESYELVLRLFCLRIVAWMMIAYPLTIFYREFGIVFIDVWGEFALWELLDHWCIFQLPQGFFSLPSLSMQPVE